VSRESLVRRLNAIPARVKAAVAPSLMASANEIADGMKALVPVRTGHLRDSIVVTPPGGTTPAYATGGSVTVPENKVAITAGNSAVRYAHLVEYGTEHAHAQPFFWPAYRLFKKRATNRIKRGIRKAVKDTANGSS
jgi:HK97 gp10 family phage protein